MSSYKTLTQNSFSRVSAKMDRCEYTHADVYNAVLIDMDKRGHNPHGWSGLDDFLRGLLKDYGYTD